MPLKKSNSDHYPKMLLRVEFSLKITQKIEGKLDYTEGNTTKTYLSLPTIYN